MHIDRNTGRRLTRTVILLAAAATALAWSPPSPVAVCSLLSAAKVSALTGRTYASARPDAIAAGVDSCLYATTAGYGLSVTIYGAPNRSTLDTLVLDIGGPKSASSVAGVGDQAFASPVGVVARFGGHLLEVGSAAAANSSSAVIPGYVAVAKAVIAAMH